MAISIATLQHANNLTYRGAEAIMNLWNLSADQLTGIFRFFIHLFSSTVYTMRVFLREGATIDRQRSVRSVRAKLAT